MLTAVAIAAPITKVYKDQGGDRMVVASGGTLQLDSGSTLTNNSGVGAIGVSSTGFSLTETGDGVTHKTVFTLASGFEYLMVDSGANGGHASLKLYDFPEGQIKQLGNTINLVLDCTQGTGTADSATYDIGLGTTATATDNAALATTEQNWLTKIEGDMSSATLANLHGVMSSDVTVDGTSTANDLYFNMAIEADDASADTVCTVSGTVTVLWANLGDY